MTDLPTPPALPGGFAAISKYNPHLWTPEQLRAIFVARQRELADLTQALKTLTPGEVGQHCLLVGARGMGKSTLMQRLALAVEDDADLNTAWLPLRFPEEQYTVSTLAQFWANVLDSLADALERRGQPTDAIDATATRLSALPVAEQAAATLHAIRQISQERGQRLLLLVDNTDLLLHNIGPQGQWALRQVLQSEPQLLWVGGSYQSLEANSQYHDAFLDFFRVIELRPLTLDEMQDALLALANSFGEETARSRLLTQLKAQPERLPTLRLLSGGNPRTTVMLYELLASGQAGHVRSDLEALLDSMTPLYKARLDALADLPRKLLAHILGHWAPMSLAQLAEASQVAKTTISPQLQRLELEGLIQKTRLHGTTRSGYQAAERFFNIWYLMRLSPRRQRTRLGWLVEFMRLWFSSDELCDLARSRMTASHGNQPYEWEYDSALSDAMPDDAPEKHGLRWHLLKQLQDRREALMQIFDFEGLDQDFKGAQDYLHRAQALPALLQRCPQAQSNDDKRRWTEAVMGSLMSLAEKERVAVTSDSLSRIQFDELQQAFTDQNLEISRAWGQEVQEAIRVAVLRLDLFPDMPDSALAFEQIRHCFANLTPVLRATALLHYQRHKDEGALNSLRLAQTALPQDAELTFAIAWLLDEKLGRHIEAEKAYRNVIALNDKIAAAWNNLGNLLTVHLGRYAEAEQAYRQAIALDQYALPWYGLGNLMTVHMGRYVEAEQAYRKAIALDDKLAYPWNGLGNLLTVHLGRYAEAEQAYRKAIALDDKLAYPWNGLGNLLQVHQGRYAEAEQAYRKAIALDVKLANPWNGLGNLLQDHLGRYAEAEEAFLKSFALDPKDQTPIANLARMFWSQGQQAKALKHFGQVAERAINQTDAEHLLLEAHLALNNQQLGQQALDRLAKQAEQGDTGKGYRLREQVWEITQLGLGERLADWMQQSPHAQYLQPMIQALYTLASAESKLQDLPAEVQQMADAVVQEAQKRLRRGDAAKGKPAAQ